MNTKYQVGFFFFPPAHKLSTCERSPNSGQSSIISLSNGLMSSRKKQEGMPQMLHQVKHSLMTYNTEIHTYREQQRYLLTLHTQQASILEGSKNNDPAIEAIYIFTYTYVSMLNYICRSKMNGVLFSMLNVNCKHMWPQ